MERVGRRGLRPGTEHLRRAAATLMIKIIIVIIVMMIVLIVVIIVVVLIVVVIIIVVTLIERNPFSPYPASAPGPALARGHIKRGGGYC